VTSYMALCEFARRRGLHVELHVGALKGPTNLEYRDPTLLRVVEISGATVRFLAARATSWASLNADAGVLLEELAG
jgi:hypothetical protein